MNKRIDPDKVNHDKQLRQELREKNGQKVMVHFQEGGSAKGMIMIKEEEIFIGGEKLDSKLVGLYKLI